MEAHSEAVYTVQREQFTLRSTVRTLFTNLVDDGYDTVDISNVEFISRTAGDELLYQADTNNLSVTGADGDVQKMLEIIADAIDDPDAGTCLSS